MAIPRQLREAIGKGNSDTVEDAWLQQLEKDPTDLELFVGIARSLVGSSQGERARTLLETLDEELVRRKLWRERLDLLRRAGSILRGSNPELHALIVATLEKLYAGSKHLAGVVEVVGLQRAASDIPKTWEKVERLEGLMPFGIGAVVRMQGKGAGRITEVNLALQSFKVDFEQHKGLTVGFRAASKMMEALKPGHILRRKLEAPEELEALVKGDPPELLRLVLETDGKPLAAGDVRRMLRGIVSESQWTSWWSAARKHPQVVAGSGAKKGYTWAATTADASQTVWKSFEKADPRKKLDLLRRRGEKDPKLAERMVNALVTLGAKMATKDTSVALEIALSLERISQSPGGDEAAGWTAQELLSAASAPAAVVAGVQDRALRERAWKLLREREDWRELYADALARETDGRNLTLLADDLQGEAALFERFADGTLVQPHKVPAAFTWLAERAATDDDLLARNPLRWIQQLLASLSRDELAPFRSRLWSQLESGGVLPRAMALLPAEQAEQAKEALERAPALETYQRKDLIAALEMRHPSLRGGQEEPLYALPTSIEAKREELRTLMEIDIPANRKAIEEARAMGDLRENFEYKAARGRHEFLNSRASEVNSQLERSRPLDLSTVDTSQVRVGTRVELADGGGATRTLTILGPWESAPEKGIISFESEAARGLIGTKVGDPVTLGGEALTVQSIGRASAP
jgi:transcription elongation GreA/GreB family factor